MLNETLSGKHSVIGQRESLCLRNAFGRRSLAWLELLMVKKKPGLDEFTAHGLVENVMSAVEWQKFHNQMAAFCVRNGTTYIVEGIQVGLVRVYPNMG